MADIIPVGVNRSTGQKKVAEDGDTLVTQEGNLLNAPNFTAMLSYGADWPGSSTNYLRVNGDPNSSSVSTSGQLTRIYMPFDGEIVGISWNSVNSTTRQMQVYLNGVAATGFTFTVNTTRRATPTPVAFSAGAFIEVRGLTTGSGDPSDVTVHVWIRSPAA